MFLIIKAIEENQKLKGVSAHLLKKLKELGEKIDTEAYPEAEELVNASDRVISAY